MKAEVVDGENLTLMTSFLVVALHSISSHFPLGFSLNSKTYICYLDLVKQKLIVASVYEFLTKQSSPIRPFRARPLEEKLTNQLKLRIPIYISVFLSQKLPRG